MVYVSTLAFGVLAAGWLLVVLLAIMIWSGRCQRPTCLDPRAVDPLPGGLASVEALTGSHRWEGNQLQVLQDQQLFDALLEEIAAARETIHIEAYVWWKGAICERIATALAARARDGIEVRLLLDALGAWKMERNLIELIRGAGGQLVFYHPFSLRALGRLNKRDHRKLALFDSRRAYVFGHGFAEEWDHEALGERAWRDTGARVEGPAVNALQAVFAQGWMSETGEVLSRARYFPEAKKAGDVTVQVIASSPRGGVSSSSLLYRMMICTARREILIRIPTSLRRPKWSSSWSPRSSVACACASSPQGRAPTAGWCAGPATSSSPRSCVAAPSSSSSSPRSITRRSWWSTATGATWARPTSTSARSTSTPRSVSASSTPAFADTLADAFERDLRRARSMALGPWTHRPLRKRAVEWAAYQIREQL